MMCLSTAGLDLEFKILGFSGILQYKYVIDFKDSLLSIAFKFYPACVILYLTELFVSVE